MNNNFLKEILFLVSFYYGFISSLYMSHAYVTYYSCTAGYNEFVKNPWRIFDRILMLKKSLTIYKNILECQDEMKTCCPKITDILITTVMNRRENTSPICQANNSSAHSCRAHFLLPAWIARIWRHFRWENVW